MYRERLVAKWIGPYVMFKWEESMLDLDIWDQYIEAFLDKVNRYYSLKSNDGPSPAEALTKIWVETNCLDDQVSNLINHCLPTIQNEIKRDMISTDEFVGRIVEPSDERKMKQDFIIVIKQKIVGLLK